MPFACNGSFCTEIFHRQEEKWWFMTRLACGGGGYDKIVIRSRDLRLLHMSRQPPASLLRGYPGEEQ